MNGWIRRLLHRTSGLIRSTSQDGCGGDSELNVGDSRSRARRVSRHPADNDSFSKIKFKIPPFNVKYDPAAYLDWE
jgi:hypothetical protein